MDIPFSQRLSVRQTRQTVLVAFLLAGLLGLLQMAIDYARVDAQIDHEAHTLLAISSVPAARLLDSRDAPLASELLHGLLQARGQHQPIRAVGQCVVMRDVFKIGRAHV